VKAWYLDTSAVVKLVRVERDSEALRRWVLAREEAGDAIVSSDIVRTEAIRVARRVDEDALPTIVLRLVDRIAMIRIDTSVFQEAGYLGSPSLRSLDALHIAAAQDLGSDLAGLVAYDERLAVAARAVGLPTASPR
jgi:uncharacterized protein